MDRIFKLMRDWWGGMKGDVKAKGGNGFIKMLSGNRVIAALG